MTSEKPICTISAAGHTITPARKRLHTAADLTAYAISTGAITPKTNPAC